MRGYGGPKEEQADYTGPDCTGPDWSWGIDTAEASRGWVQAAAPGSPTPMEQQSVPSLGAGTPA